MSYSTRLLLGLTLLLPLITVPASAQKSPQSSDYERFKRAIDTDKIEAVQAEIDRGSDINAREKNLGSRVITKVYGQTPLMYAASGAYPKPALELLLDNGAQVNARDDSGVTALMEAANFNRSGAVKLLLDHGAQVNARSNYGLTPLTIATSPTARSRFSVRKLAVVKLLLEGGAEVDGRDSNGRTPLALSAGRSYTPDIVALLLDHGAKVNAPDRNGVTPLMLAVHERGFPEIVKFLIEKGAQVDARSNNGSTPLHRAAQASIGNRYRSPLLCMTSIHPDYRRDIEEVRQRPLEMIQLLLDTGAQVDARDEDGNTPLIVAAKGTDRPEIIQLLIEKGAEVNARNNDGSTALMVAARGADSGGNIPGVTIIKSTRALLGGDIIELLLDKGANPLAIDASGMKAIDYARNNKALKDTPALKKLAELSGE
jgi:cytohesin